MGRDSARQLISWIPVPRGLISPMKEQGSMGMAGSGPLKCRITPFLHFLTVLREKPAVSGPENGLFTPMGDSSIWQN